jgi:hypothetical protein
VLKHSLGFLLFNIDNSDSFDIILKNISELIKINYSSNIVIFSNNCDKINTYNIPILHVNHAKFFDGNLWLFDVLGIVFAKNFTNLNKKILYTNETPWIKNRNNSYNEWKQLYSNDLDFVVANQYIYDIYSLCWKKPIEIMEKFDHEKIQDIIQPVI